MEHIRLRAVDQVIDGGERVVDVARSLGFDRTVVARWVIKANKHGRQSLLATVAPGAPSTPCVRIVARCREADS